MSNLSELNGKYQDHLKAVRQLNLAQWLRLATNLGVATNDREHAAKKLAIRATDRREAMNCTTEIETARCDHCDREVDDDERGDDGRLLCETCREELAWLVWRDKTEASVRTDAEKHGWDVDRATQAQTGTVYVTIDRQSPMDDEEEAGDPDDWTDGETLIVRIGDHSTAYCREDISLVMPGHESGDDHTYAWFLSRLQTKPGHLDD